MEATYTEKKQPSIDIVTAFTILLLFIIGEISIISIWIVPAFIDGSLSPYVFKRASMQAITFFVGAFIALIIAKHVDYRIFRNTKVIYTLVCLSLISLIWVLVMKEIAGKPVNRWLFGSSVQPSEFVKIIIVLFASNYIARKKGLYKNGYILWAAFIVIAHVLLIYFQPDKGMALFILFVSSVLFFIGGISKRVYIPILIAFSLLGYYFISGGGYVEERINVWLDPSKDPAGKGYQIIRSLVYFQKGGFLGQGIGKGVHKQSHLPELDSDYIFAVIGTEWGFIGTTFILSLYALIIVRLLLISLKLRDIFPKLIVLGLTINFGLSVIVNIAMTLNLLPPKGIALPLLSYGPSNLLATLISFGIIGSIYARHKNEFK